MMTTVLDGGSRLSLVPEPHRDFDFLPPSLVSRFQSSDYQERADASSEILYLTRTASIDAIDVRRLLEFISPYVSDQNYATAQNASMILSTIIGHLSLAGQSLQPFLHQIVGIAILQFEDHRRVVSQLGQSIFRDLIGAVDPYNVISELVRAASNPSPGAHVEILRCLTSLLSQDNMDAEVLLQFPFFFDTALLSEHSNVRQAVIWMIDYLQQLSPQYHIQLVNLLSRDAAIVLGKAGANPATADPRTRAAMIFRGRIVNTAGQLDSGKVKSMPLARTLLMTRNQYQRPLLPHRAIPGTAIRPDTSVAPVESPPQFAQLDLNASLPPRYRPPLFGEVETDTTVTFSDPPLSQEPSVSEKPKPVRKRIITFDSLLSADSDLPSVPRPRAKSHFQMHDDQDLITDQPIRASGVYNLGEDIEFDDPPIPPVKKRPTVKPHSKPAPPPRSKPKATQIALPISAKISLPVIIDKLKSNEWTDQNQAITELMTNIDQLPVQSELRGVMASLVDCAASVRSALAKNALGCILKLLNSGLHFDPIADMCGGSLLGLVISHKDKHFISELAEQCFAQLLESLSPAVAIDILVGEHRRKHDDARVQVAAAMVKVVPRVTDFARLSRPLVSLLKDRNPNVRKFARAAVSAVRLRARNFDEIVQMFESEEERKALLEAF
jgi:hypothetical protein